MPFYIWAGLLTIGRDQRAGRLDLFLALTGVSVLWPAENIATGILLVHQRTSTWFAIALADRRYCADQVPGDFDIVANFNSAFADWYFGTHGLVPASKWDRDSGAARTGPRLGLCWLNALRRRQCR